MSGHRPPKRTAAEFAPQRRGLGVEFGRVVGDDHLTPFWRKVRHGSADAFILG